MALIGIQLNRKNPEFTSADFTFWMPQYKNYIATEDGRVAYNNLFEIANNKIFYSIYGTDWKLAMSLCIAHYLTLIANQVQAPSGNTLAGIAGGATHGVLASATIGSFSKSYDLSKTMVDEDEALFWNQTSYGAELMALLKTKAVPSILVVTSNPIPDPPCPNYPFGPKPPRPDVPWI